MDYIKRTASEWTELVSVFEESGLAIPSFCKKYNVGRSGLYNWRRRLGFVGPGQKSSSKKRRAISVKEDWDLLVPSPPRPHSVALSAHEDTDAAWDIELCLGADITLRIRR
tara:strand:+ start:177 stop:509 length:333 start_codon:yes stop_codon:yes gene_type:complete